MRTEWERDLIAREILAEIYSVSEFHHRLAREYVRWTIEAAARSAPVSHQMASDYSYGNLRMLLDDLACCEKGFSLDVGVPLEWLLEVTDKKWLGQKEEVYSGLATPYGCPRELLELFDLAVKAVNAENGTVSDLIVVLTLAARDLIDRFIEDYDIPYVAFFSDLQEDFATVEYNKEVYCGQLHKDFKADRCFHAFGDEGERVMLLGEMPLK